MGKVFLFNAEWDVRVDLMPALGPFNITTLIIAHLHHIDFWFLYNIFIKIGNIDSGNVEVQTVKFVVISVKFLFEDLFNLVAIFFTDIFVTTYHVLVVSELVLLYACVYFPALVPWWPPTGSSWTQTNSVALIEEVVVCYEARVVLGKGDVVGVFGVA